MFQRIVENIAAKILQRVAGGRLAFWRWPNVSGFFSALSFLAVLGLGACNDFTMPDPSDGVAAGQAYIVVKNTTAEELLIGLDENADDQGALNDERRTLSVGAEEEFEVEIPGDSRKVWLKLPGYAAEPIKLRSKEFKKITADRVYSCVNMEFSSYTTSGKGIKIVPDDPEKIAGSSVVYPDEEGGCPAFAQNLITSTANAAGENEFSIEDGTRGQEIIKEFSIVIRADYEAKVRFEKLGDLIGFRYQSDKSLVDLTKDGATDGALELQMTKDPHKFVQENALPELELEFVVDGTAAEISFDDKENWIRLPDIDTPTEQKFEVRYWDADGDELGYLLMANVKASDKNGFDLPRTEEVEGEGVEKEEVEAGNKIADPESVKKENYTKDQPITYELKLYSPVKGKSEIANMSRDQRHRVEVTARVDDGMKDGRGKAEVTRTLYVNVAPEINALKFGDGTDVSDIVETEKDNWLQLDSGDKTSFSVAATDADDGTDLSYSWTVNDQAVGENKDTVELDLGSLAKDHKVEVSVTVSDGVVEVPETRTLYVNVAPTQPTEIKEVERGQLVPGESARKYTLELVGGMDPDGDQLEYEWKVKNGIKDFVFKPRDLVKSLEYSSIVTVELPLNETYTIRARLKDGYGGEVDWTEKKITVENLAPRITNLSGNDSVWDDYESWIQLDALDNPVLKTFTVAATDDDDDNLTYIWKVNDREYNRDSSKKGVVSFYSPMSPHKGFKDDSDDETDPNKARHKVVVAVTVSDGEKEATEPKERTLYVNVKPTQPTGIEVKERDKLLKNQKTGEWERNYTLELVGGMDPDGDQLEYEWEYVGPTTDNIVFNPRDLVKSLEYSKIVTVELPLGPHKIRARLKDKYGGKGKWFEEEITVGNHEPTITELQFGDGTDVSDIVETEKDNWLQLNSGEETSFTVEAEDLDGDNLTYSWTVNGEEQQDKKTATVELDEDFLASASKNKGHKVVVAVTVSDGAEGKDSQERTLYVNVAPEIKTLKFADGTDVSDIGENNKDDWLQLDSGEKTSFTVAATDADDGADLTYSWKVNNEEQQDKKTATVELDLSSTGDHKVVVAVTVSDGAEEKDSQARTLYVNVAPTPTEIKATPGKLVEKNPGSLARKYTLALVGGTDPDGDQLEYEWEYVDPTTDKIVFTPENSRNVTVILPLNQTHIIRARLKDGHKGKGEWFEKEITVGNHAPTIDKIKIEKDNTQEVLEKDKNIYTQDNPLQLDSGEKTSFTVEAADPDGDDLTYSWTVNNEEQKDKKTATLVLDQDFLASASKNKDHKVVVAVKVSDGVVDSEPLMRTLYVNVAPRITSLWGEDSKWDDEANNYKSWIQLDALNSDVETEFTVVAEDLDGDDLTYTWTVNGEEKKQVSERSVVLNLYSPMNEANGIKDKSETDSNKKRHKLVVAVTVSDGAKGKDSKERTLYVNVRPTKPEIRVERPSKPGEKYSFELVSGMDPDDDDVKYDWDLSFWDSSSTIRFFDIELQSEKSLGQSRKVTAPGRLSLHQWMIQARLIDPYGGEGDYSDYVN